MREGTEFSGSQRAIAIIGGGAAGFFAALTAAEVDPAARVSIHERGRQYLSKVKVSGGGRCNVTHSCFDPARLAAHYPRGARELRGAFHRWQPQDTIDWFKDRGVALKTEADGRMFPITDDSQTIIDCFMDAARTSRVELFSNQALRDIKPLAEGGFELDFGEAGTVTADKVCLACGSLKASPVAQAIQSLGHAIEPLAPSLFAFNVSDTRIHGLSGLSVQAASVRIVDEGGTQSGPLLVTHRGMSGPAILRLSAWEARSLQQRGYEFELSVNWLGDVTTNQLQEEFARLRRKSGKAGVRTRPMEAVPRRLWESLAAAAGIEPETIWAHLPKPQEEAFIRELLDGRYVVRGKTTNKEEFVTCGGVRLKEVDFRTMESRLVPGLHFAGECLDIDGITGGFNFQAAWTTGRIAGQGLCQ